MPPSFMNSGTKLMSSDYMHRMPGKFDYIDIAGQRMPARQADWDAMRSMIKERAAYQGSVDIAKKSFFSRPSFMRGPFISSVTKTGMKSAWAGMKINAQLARGAYRGANALSRVALGASLGQVGAAAGIVGAGLYMAGSALGINRQQVHQFGSAINEMMKENSRPKYGYSELGQSTQGLVFGLNSRRTA